MNAAFYPLVLAMLVIALLALGIFNTLLPDVQLAWRSVWIGAAVTALLFTLGTTLDQPLSRPQPVASVYGTAGSLIVLLADGYPRVARRGT